MTQEQLQPHLPASCQCYSVTDQASAKEFYHTAAAQDERVVVFVGEDVYLGLDLRFTVDAVAVVFSKGLLGREELM